jgi:hypothetical protein
VGAASSTSYHPEKEYTMFVKFDCGCIGILDPPRLPIIVKQCDDNGDTPIGFHRRDMSEKSSQPVPMDTVGEDIIRGIEFLMGDGYRFREVQFLLGIRPVAPAPAMERDLRKAIAGLLNYSFHELVSFDDLTDAEKAIVGDKAMYNRLRKIAEEYDVQ